MFVLNPAYDVVISVFNALLISEPGNFHVVLLSILLITAIYLTQRFFNPRIWLRREQRKETHKERKRLERAHTIDELEAREVVKKLLAEKRRDEAENAAMKDSKVEFDEAEENEQVEKLVQAVLAEIVTWRRGAVV